jgi:phage repressor protein C with HTH and peptisase S24 domain
MKPIQDIRRARLRLLIDEVFSGNVSSFAIATGKSQSQISSTLSGRKAFGERLARQIERDSNLVQGALDVPIDEEGLSLVPPGGFGFVRFFRDESAPLYFRLSWFQGRGLNPEDFAAFRVIDTAMEPTLNTSDIVVSNLRDTALIDGRSVLVDFEGELIVRRLCRNNAAWTLVPDNPAHGRFTDKSIVGAEIIGALVCKFSDHV